MTKKKHCMRICVQAFDFGTVSNIIIIRPDELTKVNYTELCYYVSSSYRVLSVLPPSNNTFIVLVDQQYVHGLLNISNKSSKRGD